ncbi:unnamed protein product, partial [Mesorhabditis belari]|uniref:Cationic amino acid transporter C-terminal domain-containing protein n=1 Tax=Mesorhabditis belari TaxID=2138241 RepID=A0AAF3EUC5_9BILA
MKQLLQKILRRKRFETTPLDTNLKRCLTTFDVTMIGVGQTIGAGIYVLTGTVIRNTAGPSIVLSFILAGFAAFFSALCYAEFGSRFPKAGSAYSYAYIGCGEIWAFIIGWDVVLENMLSAAVVARAWSGYINVLADNAIKNFTIHHIGGLHTSIFSDYLDVLAFIIAIVICVIMSGGVKGSATFNSLNGLLNIAMIAVVTIFAFIYADFNNWTGTTADGTSKFFPYGFSGTLAGAASCFFSFIGFDGLATAGEEAKDPVKAIPKATFYCMGIVTTVYVLMSSAISLIAPYTEIDPDAAFVSAFKDRGAQIPVICVTIGAICGMTGSMFGCLFALPRCVYAMAEDGLIFKFFSIVNPRTKVPIYAIAVFGLMTAIMAALFNVETLVDFLSSGTLMAYSMVAVCVIVLRYRQDYSNDNRENRFFKLRIPNWIMKFTNTRSVVAGLIPMLFGFAGFGICMSSGFWSSGWAGKACAILFLLFACCCIIWIGLHSQNDDVLTFKVPFVPILPAFSLFLNTMMLANLDYLVWIRFGIWLAVGLGIYFLYGMHHSLEGKKEKQLHVPPILTEKF